MLASMSNENRRGGIEKESVLAWTREAKQKRFSYDGGWDAEMSFIDEVTRFRICREGRQGSRHGKPTALVEHASFKSAIHQIHSSERSPASSREGSIHNATYDLNL